MSAPDNQEMLTPEQVAALYGVDAKTVTRWAVKGRLIAVKTPGGARRYPSAQFAAVVATRRKALEAGS